MICRITGVLAEIGADALIVDVSGIGYEVLAPASALAAMQRLLGQVVTLHTIQHFEGNPVGSHLTPRLIGFPTALEREFFKCFTSVKGISFRRGLRAMIAPVPQIAAAIESGDLRLLTSLPEVGKKTAQQIVADLQGKLQGFVGASTAPVAAAPTMTEAQRLATEILVQWGDRRADAQRWVSAAIEADPSLKEPDAIVRAAYAIKTRG